MKKIIFTFLIIFYNSFLSSQNNSYKKITENKIHLIQKDEAYINSHYKFLQTSLNIDVLYQLIFIYLQKEHPEAIDQLNSEKNIYHKFNLLINWLDQQQSYSIWQDYFSIHNQVIAVLQYEIYKLIENNSDFEYLCQNIGKPILNALYNVILTSYENKDKNNKILNLIYIYQDYLKIFNKFINIDNSAIETIFNTLKNQNGANNSGASGSANSTGVIITILENINTGSSGITGSTGITGIINSVSVTGITETITSNSTSTPIINTITSSLTKPKGKDKDK